MCPLVLPSSLTLPPPLSPLSPLSPSSPLPPFLPSPPSLPLLSSSIYATRAGDRMLFHHEGGMEVGDVDAKAERVDVAIEDLLTREQAQQLVAKATPEVQP